MRWIGLRDGKERLFDPDGIRPNSQRMPQPDAILAQGTLLIETRIVASLTEQTLLDFDTDNPWRSSLTVVLHPDGVLTLTQTAGRSTRVHRLMTDLQEKATAITIVFTWDAPARNAAVSVEVPDTGALWFAPCADPLPMTQRDAVRISTDRKSCFLSRNVNFVGIGDSRMPIGPLPSLDGATWIDTDTGRRPISSLRVGDRVRTAAGDLSQVRWVGALSLPAFARFRPMRLRAPFYGATRDLDCAACQQIRFQDTTVEYLFDTHAVSARAGDLLDGLSDRRRPGQLTERYWQVLLDRPVPMMAHGLPCESLNAARLVAEPALRALSVLKNLPLELLPRMPSPASQRLCGYQVRSLCSSRVA